MNTQELDRLLCERLGIDPEKEWFRPENPDGSWGEAQERLSYPALSTTGNGMVLLMKVLRDSWHDFKIEGSNYGYGLYRVCVKGFLDDVPIMGFGNDEDSAPLALALAAAKALGIAVPE